MSPRREQVPMPTVADAAVRDVPLLVGSVRQRRAAEFEKRGIRLAAFGSQVRVVDDERAPGSGAVVYVDEDGQLYDRRPANADPTMMTRPDLVGVDLDDDIGRLVELYLVDVDAYDVAVRRRQAADDRARAEQVAAETAAANARRAAPLQVLVEPGLGLAELLERVAAADAQLTLHDDRVLLQVPVAPHVAAATAVQLGLGVTRLQTLLIASRCGDLEVACDVDACTQPADRVAVGGAYLCSQHAR